MNLWEEILSRIETKVNRHSFYTWFKPTAFVSDGGNAITVRVPNLLFKDWLTKHYSVVLSEALAEVRRSGAALVFVAEGVPAPAPPADMPSAAAGDEADAPVGTAPVSSGGLNPRYTFDTSASTTGGGHVRIGPGLVATNLNDPNTVDKLGFGTANQPEGSAAPSHPAAGGSLERKAYSTSTSATMAVGGVDANRGNGTDSNNNASDFVTRAVRQPQNSASPTESP